MVSLVAVLLIVLGVGVNSVGSKSYWKNVWQAVRGEPVKGIDVEDMEKQDTEDVDEIVEYLHNIYMNNDEMSYAYPKVAEAAAEVCNFDLQGLLHSIRKNSAKMEEQILTQIIWRYLK